MGNHVRYRWSWLIALCGCVNAQEFTVVRPAVLQLARGHVIRVGSIAAPDDSSAGRELASELSSRVTRNTDLNPDHTDGDLLVSGEVLSSGYHEIVESRTGTCTRTAATVHSGGSDTDRIEEYPCNVPHRVGTAIARAQLTLTTRQTAEVVYSRFYEQVAHRDVVGSEGSSPPPIDAAAVTREALTRIADRFARVILPSRETVHARFDSCDGDARCGRVPDLVRRGELQSAEISLNPVTSAGDGGTQSTDRISGALYNRGLVREFRGDYAGALADLTRAVEMRPAAAAQWRHDVDAVRELLAEAAASPPPGSTEPSAMPIVRVPASSSP